jgi:hypothetical protein
MIIAIVVVDNSDLRLHGKAPCFAELGKEAALEHLVRTVVRGPFGVTIVAATPHNSSEIKKLLGGFAVQFVDAASDQQLLSAALKFAADYRLRWEKVMADAKARFAGKDDDDEDDSRKQIRKPGGKGGAKDWANLKSSSDVKVRGLARSFDRDGIMLFPADRPAISLELQAQMVEAFGREQADKGAKARPIAQAVFAGERGYPVILDLPAAKELEVLPPATNFDDWLLAQLVRIQDVPVQDRGATSILRTENDLSEIMSLLKLKAQQ